VEGRGRMERMVLVGLRRWKKKKKGALVVVVVAVVVVGEMGKGVGLEPRS
jgi:hypothetical protein